MDEYIEGVCTEAILNDKGRASVFCSKEVFNFSQRVLSETEIQVLKKGLDFAPVQISINKPEFIV